MHVCPKCKCSFREGFTVCSDCGVDLVDSHEHLEVEVQDINESLEDKWVFLKNVAEGYDAHITIATLESNNIIVLKKQEGSGQYQSIYFGRNFYGINLFVPSKQLEKAQEILMTLNPDFENEDKNMDNEEELDEKEHIKKTRCFRLFILIMIIPGIIVFLISIFPLLAELFQIILN